MDAVELIRKRVAWCEAEGVEILCCAEAVLGGLADYAAHPADIAIDVESGQLDAVLTPLTSDTVTTIVGFTERAGTGELYNSAAVLHRGSVIGIYRKLHPAIRKSIYRAGERIPVFHVGGLTFGIVICNDSNHVEPARIMASQGAAVLFVPTNNGLPPGKAESSLTRGTRTSPARWRTACGSSVPMSPAAPRIWCPTDRPVSLIRMAGSCNRRSG